MKILHYTKEGAARRGPFSRSCQRSGFTMIEIAISLGVIAVALVAIIGILPTGMNVQRQNREETIINQDANFLLNAIRNGERGVDDLTNYVLAITNTSIVFNPDGSVRNGPTTYGYTFRASSHNPQYPITNGFRIIGLLSTPKYIPLYVDSQNPRAPTYNGFVSNRVVATVMAISGPASDKFPQTNSAVRELALTYRLFSSVEPFEPVDPWLGTIPPTSSTNEWINWSNHWLVASNVKSNLHDVRLTYRWPLFSGGKMGDGRQMYRTMAGGVLTQATNEPGFGLIPSPHQIYFFEPRTYVKAP